MAWTAPTTRTSGDLITAAIWNTDVVNNLIALRGGAISITSQAALDFIYASASGQLGRLAAGSALQIPRINASANAWEFATLNDPSTITVTAGETLVAGDVVYIVTWGTGTLGRAYKLTVTAKMAVRRIMGPYICTVGASAGNSASVQISGVVTGLSGLTAGVPYYVNAGALSATPVVPTNSRCFMMVGIALSTTTLLLGQSIGTSEALAAGNATYGYWMGGYTGATVTVATADRVTFATSTTAARTASNLATARTTTCLSDTKAYGYSMGGLTGSGGGTYTQICSRMPFATGVDSAHTAGQQFMLANVQGYQQGLSDGMNYGYALGDATGTLLNRMDYATGLNGMQPIPPSAWSASFGDDPSPGVVPYGRGVGTCPISDGVRWGWWAGGAGPSNKIALMTFSTGQMLNSHTSLSAARNWAGGLNDGSTYGYCCGGNTGAAAITTDRITFSTGTSGARTVSDLLAASQYNVGLSDDGTYGYLKMPTLARVDRMTFSTGVFATSTANAFSQDRAGNGAMSDGNV